MERMWRCMECGTPCGPMWGDPDVLREHVERGLVTLLCVACAAVGEAEAITASVDGTEKERR